MHVYSRAVHRQPEACRSKHAVLPGSEKDRQADHLPPILITVLSYWNWRENHASAITNRLSSRIISHAAESIAWFHTRGGTTYPVGDTSEPRVNLRSLQSPLRHGLLRRKPRRLIEVLHHLTWHFAVTPHEGARPGGRVGVRATAGGVDWTGVKTRVSPCHGRRQIHQRYLRSWRTTDRFRGCRG